MSMQRLPGIIRALHTPSGIRYTYYLKSHTYISFELFHNYLNEMHGSTTYLINQNPAPNMAGISHEGEMLPRPPTFRAQCRIRTYEVVHTRGGSLLRSPTYGTCLSLTYLDSMLA